MNDPATLNGAPRSLTVAGVTYQVHPLTFADLGELQIWIEAQYPDPITVAAAALAKLPTSLHKHLTTAALELASRPKPRLGTPEADRLLLSPEGFGELLRITIQKGDPSFTREQARLLFADMSLAQAAQVLKLTGLDLVVEPQPSPSQCGGGDDDPKAPAAATRP